MMILFRGIERHGMVHSVTIQRHKRLSAWAGVLAILLIAFIAGAAYAKTGSGVKQRTFSSPDEAVRALTTAVKDNNDKALVAILGPKSGNLISSGDKVDDRKGRERFLKAYEEKNRIILIDEKKAVIHIGSQDRVFPIPVVKKENSWLFDTEAGKEELLCRRIGRNELNVIEVLHAYTDAQREYAARDRDNDSVMEFAQRLISTKGKKDGLYWESKEGGEESPFGPLIAKAAQEGYTDRAVMEPFHGYYFRILKAQGPNAKGGAFDYVVRGHMVLGFGLLAYPAQYGASGIMTFMVNQQGVIYQKDLGRKTGKAVASTTFDPDNSWKEIEAASRQ
jgi:Protein of unknown function (DUF2950)